MKQSTLARWLKATIVVVTLVGLLIYLYLIPEYGWEIAVCSPEVAYCYWPWQLFLWGTGIPCFAALVLAWCIAGNIGKDRSFSHANARLLKVISWLAAGDAVYFLVGNFVLLFADMSHPGVVFYALFFVIAGLAISVAAAALSHLVQKAALLQEQNDLTI